MKNISKVGVKQYIIISFFLIITIYGCDQIIPINKLVFRDCEIYSENQLFTGKYKQNKGNQYILTKVSEGKVLFEKIFINNKLLMEKKFDSCGSGFQKNYNLKGKILSKGTFVNYERKGEWEYFIQDSVYIIKY